MKLTGELKKQVEKAETREAAKEAIASAGMLLTDDELDRVGGGYSGYSMTAFYCEDCRKGFEMPSSMVRPGFKAVCTTCRGNNTHPA